jgi:hypothetical protein
LNITEAREEAPSLVRSYIHFIRRTLMLGDSTEKSLTINFFHMRSVTGIIIESGILRGLHLDQEKLKVDIPAGSPRTGICMA